MKQITTIYLILLLTVISGCSKHEPPAAKTPLPAKKPAVEKYILDVPAVTSETKFQAMAQVRITDEDTGLPITHAAVRIRWISDDGPKMCPGVHIEEGNYEVPTNGLKGVFYVGALADGYLPTDKENPKFPVELSMKEGETIEVSGTIHHANGDPVTNGIVNLRMINTYLWGTQWPQLYPCSVTPDGKGEFLLAHVPVGLNNVYARYDLSNSTTKDEIPIKYDLHTSASIDFKDQTFSTSGGDIHLTLCLPPELIIRGKIVFSSGSAVSGAWVWTEEVTGDEPDAWNKQLTDKNEALCGSAIQSDAEGYFELSVLKKMERFVVKAIHPRYIPAYIGPFSDSEPPPDPVKIIILEDGSHLFGRLSTTTGEPVTNSTLQYGVMKIESRHIACTKCNMVLLDIAEDGQYISGIVPPGSYEVTFIAPGYDQQRKKVIIQKNAVEQCDIVFFPYCVTTGIVYDVNTRLPIPGVMLINGEQSSKKNPSFSKKTDQNGMFWVLHDTSYIQLVFQHPDYASIVCSFTKPRSRKNTAPADREKELYPKILLSKRGSLRVIGRKDDGTPLDGYSVWLSAGNPDTVPKGNYDYLYTYQRTLFTEGEALLTNIPVMYSPVYAEVGAKTQRRILAKSDLVSLVAGEEATVTVTLPPTGSLVLKYMYPIDPDTIIIDGSIQEENAKQMFSNYDFTTEKQKMILNGVPANEYRIIIDSKTGLSIVTNVSITANNTTEIIINNGTNVMASISGTVSIRKGYIPQCFFSVREQPPGTKTAYTQTVFDNTFVFNGLSPGRVYDLTVNMPEGSGTNITINGIVPGRAPVNIQLPDAYRITGNVIDGDGNPLKAIIGIKSKKEYGPGEFTLYPVFQGTYSVCVKAKDYETVEREVTVYDSNVDFGDIVLKTKTD